MSRLRKREHGSETGAASAVMDIGQSNIRLRLKIERRMAAPFSVKLSFQHHKHSTLLTIKFETICMMAVADP